MMRRQRDEAAGGEPAASGKTFTQPTNRITTISIRRHRLPPRVVDDLRRSLRAIAEGQR